MAFSIALFWPGNANLLSILLQEAVARLMLSNRHLDDKRAIGQLPLNS